MGSAASTLASPAVSAPFKAITSPSSVDQSVATFPESTSVATEYDEAKSSTLDTTPKVFVMTGSFKDGLTVSSVTEVTSDETSSLVSAISDAEYSPSYRVTQWDRKTLYSDLIRDGLEYLKRENSNVVMLFESPSTSSSDCSFYNQIYRFHDYPPSNPATKALLGPCRYSLMNGSTYPTFLKTGTPPVGLMEHWEKYVPNFQPPKFVSELPQDSQVYAYLPVDAIAKHVNDLHIHYLLCGKDRIPLITNKTTKLLSSTKEQRPCIVKTTHSMGSKGIFIIRNDSDEKAFFDFLEESGNPSYIVTEFIDIDRNVACHFYMHPSGEITWFGSNENLRNEEDGSWSSDSYLIGAEQDNLRNMQMPFVRDVAQYCHSLGFWGLCGIDVLFDKSGKGYLVDVNPRVTGSCPSLMVASLLQDKHSFNVGLFRRSGDDCFYGSLETLFATVQEHNEGNVGESQVVIFAVNPVEPERCTVNIAVYGNDLYVCKQVMNGIVKPKPV